MKTTKLSIITCLFLALFIATINPIFGQQPVSGIQCDGCVRMNGDHKPTCIYYNPSTKSNSKSSAVNLENQIMGAIFFSFLKSGSSSTNEIDKKTEEEKTQREAEKKEKMKQLSIKIAILNRYNDSVAQAGHEKMMKDYKKLDGSGDLAYKGLDNQKKWNASVNFKCKITSFKGDVTVVKSNGQMVTLSANQALDLAAGDWIATGLKSSVKLHYSFETGGEDLLLGQNSAINIITNENGNHIPKVLRGNLYVTNNMVSEKMAETQEKIMTEAEKQYAQLKKKFSEKQIRTQSAICGIRGTEFTIHVDTTGTTEVVVKNGIVDLKGNIVESIITLTAGNKGIVTSEGVVKGPIKFEESEINKWWE